MLWLNIGQYEMEHCRTEYKQCVTVIVYHKEVLCLHVDDASDHEWELVKKGWNKVNAFSSIIYYNLN